MKAHSKSQAIIVAPALAPGAPLITGALLCTASLVASARPLQIKLPNLPNLPNLPELPKVPKLPNLPKLNLPDLDLPNFGKKTPAKKPAARAPRTVRQGNVKIRPASGVVPSDAPTLAELQGGVTAGTITDSEGWKRFPSRRMPGANMESWKNLAKQVGPKN
ncbi:unnamed protein product [Agarophyton chilense]